jgi:hypothetical protein
VVAAGRRGPPGDPGVPRAGRRDRPDKAAPGSIRGDLGRDWGTRCSRTSSTAPTPRSRPPRDRLWFPGCRHPQTVPEDNEVAREERVWTPPRCGSCRGR